MMALFDLLAGRTVTLDEAGWRSVLALAHRTLSTPLLRGHGPAWVQSEVEACIAKVEQKRKRLQETFGESAAVLSRAGIEFVLLKGFTHASEVPRAQNDIDLWVRDVAGAQRALLNAGFVHHNGHDLSHNHVAPLLKPHNWRWRGDYFDPEMPVPVELHFTLWNEARERIAAPRLHEFWDRRVVEAGVCVLAPADRLGFAALHVLRHGLRNNVRPAQAWELAHMMVRGDSMQAHSPQVRQLESIALCLAASWFGRPLPPGVELPECARDWFARYRLSPLRNLIEPNKDSLWLHLALAGGAWDRFVIARRRLLPLRWPRREEAVEGSYAAFVLGRLRHHAVTLARLGAIDSKARHTPD